MRYFLKCLYKINSLPSMSVSFHLLLFLHFCFFFTSSFGSFSHYPFLPPSLPFSLLPPLPPSLPFPPYPFLPPSLPFSHLPPSFSPFSSLPPLSPSLPFSHLPPCLSHSVHHPPILVSTTFLLAGFLTSFLLFTFLPLCLVRNKSQIKQIPLLLLLYVGRSTRLASRSWLLVGPLSHPKNKVEIMN